MDDYLGGGHSRMERGGEGAEEKQSHQCSHYSWASKVYTPCICYDYLIANAGVTGRVEGGM